MSVDKTPKNDTEIDATESITVESITEKVSTSVSAAVESADLKFFDTVFGKEILESASEEDKVDVEQARELAKANFKAVCEKVVNPISEQIHNELKTIVSESVALQEEKFNTKFTEFAEKFVEDNHTSFDQEAVLESSIEFIGDIKAVLEKHDIALHDENGLSALEEISADFTDLESKYNTACEEIATLKKDVMESSKMSVIESLTAPLTVPMAESVKSICKYLPYEDKESFSSLVENTIASMSLKDGDKTQSDDMKTDVANLDKAPVKTESDNLDSSTTKTTDNSLYRNDVLDIIG